MRNCGSQSVYLPIYICIFIFYRLYISYIYILSSIFLSICLSPYLLYEGTLCSPSMEKQWLSVSIFQHTVCPALSLCGETLFLLICLSIHLSLQIYIWSYLCNFSLYYLSITYLHSYLYYKYLYL